MANKKLELFELEDLTVGEEIVDWEGDAMVQEQPGVWFYRDQPMRGNTPRGFTTAVVHQAFGPAAMLSPKTRKVGA